MGLDDEAVGQWSLVEVIRVVAVLIAIDEEGLAADLRLGHAERESRLVPEHAAALGRREAGDAQE